MSPEASQHTVHNTGPSQKTQNIVFFGLLVLPKTDLIES